MNTTIFTIIYIVVIIGAFYLIAIKPQQKQDKLKKELLSTMQVGDFVKTTNGFIGQLIDISEDTVIVEFGNNKNCRIPMEKSAIAQVEKADET
jgi:preprotein translocase subunit YajC